MKEIPEFTKKMQDAIDRLKRGRASDSNVIRAEDIKECDEETKEMIRQIFNEIIKQKECTLEIWQRTRIKVIFKKGRCGKCKQLPPQFVHCQLCTNYSRHCFTPGCAQGSTHVNHLTREGSEDLIKLLITSQCTDCWSNAVKSGASHRAYLRLISPKAFNRIKREHLWKSLEH